jgi:hypothetical protein
VADLQGRFFCTPLMKHRNTTTLGNASHPGRSANIRRERSLGAREHWGSLAVLLRLPREGYAHSIETVSEPLLSLVSGSVKRNVTP